MRELADFPAVRPHVAASKHEGGSAFNDRSEQLGVVSDVIFQVRVLDEQYVPGRSREALSDCMTLAHRPRLINNLNFRRKFRRMTCVKLRDDFTGAIGRVALNYDDLFRGFWKGLCPDTLQKRRDRGGFIVDGNDDGYFHGCPQIRRRCHQSEYRPGLGGLHGPENMCRRCDSVPDMLSMLHEPQD